MERELDKSSGNVLIFQGDIYYSPNSTRSVSLPPQNPKIGTENTIFQIKCSRGDDFIDPYWWTETLGWLAFIPRKPSYTGPLFDRLAKVPKHLYHSWKNGKDVYSLPPELRDSWVKLDWWLSCATSVLAKDFNSSVVRPFSPWTLGYNEESYSHRYMLARIHRSHGWFKLWMGMLSHLIAKAKSANSLGTDWIRVLSGNGFTFDTLDALEASTVCNFSRNIERAGVFLDVTSRDTRQPTVEWFLKYNVPIWYRWGSQEMSIPSLAYLCPLDDQMQRAMLMVANPVQEMRVLAAQDEPEPSTLQKKNEPTKERPTSAKKPEYEVFFAARAERNARRILHESPADLRTRLQRERRPPTISARVYKWSRSEDNKNVWCRVQVHKVDREETLGEYSEAQKRYDSFSNEWDCCEEFGPGDDHDDDFEEVWLHGESIDSSDVIAAPYDDTTLPKVISLPQPALLVDAKRLDVPQAHPLHRHVVPYPNPASPNWLPSSPEPTSPAPPEPKSFKSKIIDALQQEILEILALYYGFTPPLPLPSSLPLLTDEVECRNLVRWLGLSWNECCSYIKAVPCASLAKSYLDKIISKQRPKDDECDFNIQSRLSLSTCERCRYLRIVESVSAKRKPLYMFDFGIKSEVPWKLTLTTAADALLVCRLDFRLRESEIAEYLLQHGIPFRTFISSEVASGAPRQSLPPGVLPTRPSNAQFWVKDYDSYVWNRETLLNHPRARAALMRGGISWRLSSSVVSFSSVLQGPTGWFPVSDTMVIARDPKTYEMFIDDALTEVEFDLICGTYICQTDTYRQTSRRSWFASVSTFDASGENYGRWNAYLEDSLSRRFDEIGDLSRQATSRGPITAKKWRDLLRGNKNVRCLKETIEAWSQAFIKQHVIGNFIYDSKR